MAHDLEKKWRSKDVQLREDVDFSALLLSDRVLFGLKKAGFKKPSPIQLEAIPLSKIGKDLLVQAKSGTGKTLVFVITALEMLRRKLFRPQVMILVPTREIATQICSVIKTVGSGYPKLTCCSFIGGLSVAEDVENSQNCQIVVGTPGRLNHLINDKCMPTSSIRLLVFDEADRLLNLSFKNDMNTIFTALPEDKQVIATSATYPEKLKKLLLKYLREPHIACLHSREIALLGMIHYAKVIKSCPMPVIQYRQKLAALEDILKGVKFSQCLVFCNGIQRVEVVYKDIKKWGFSAAYISSANEQYDRLKAIDRLKHFKCKVLVSSDVTARGIDAENVDLVVNFDFAFGTETYMHRAGRAGRYGSVGVNISIIEEKDVIYLKRMEIEASFKAYKLPDPILVDLIQSRSFGEYVIEDTDSEEPDSDEGAAALNEIKPDDIKPDASVDNVNNIVEEVNDESADNNMCVLDKSTDGSDSVLTDQTSTENISETVLVNCPALSKSDILQLFCNGTNTVASENNSNSINVRVENELPVKEDNVDKRICDSHPQSVPQSENLADVSKPVVTYPSSRKTALFLQLKSPGLDIQSNDAVPSKNVSTSTNAGVENGLPVKEDENVHENLGDSNIQNAPQSQKLPDVSCLTETTLFENVWNSMNVIAESRLPVTEENTDENSSDSYIQNVPRSFEAIISAKTQTNLNSESAQDEKTNDGMEKDEVEACSEKLDESTSLSSEFIDVRNYTENGDVNDIFTSDIFVKDNLNENDLNNVIKLFLSEYEVEKSMKSSDLPNEEESEEDVSGKKTISVCAINNLNSKKHTYVYEVCKKYQDEQNKESGENVDGTLNVISPDKMCEQGVPSLDITCNGIDLETDNNYNSSSTEQNNTNSVERPESFEGKEPCKDGKSKLADALCCVLDNHYKIQKVVDEIDKITEGAIETLRLFDPVDLLESEVDSNYSVRRVVYKDADNLVDRPNCESTPAERKGLLSQNGVQSLFNEMGTSESGSSDTELPEEANLNVSKSPSSSEDSEEESSSDSSESSSSEDSYHHNKSRSGKQNPSLVSSSSSSDVSEEQNERKHGQNSNCFPNCCHSGNFRPYQPIHHSFNNPHHSHRSSNIRRQKTVPRHACGAHSHPERSLFSGQHFSSCDRSFFQPSKCRCHSDSACNQMPANSHWHQTFYSQWKHLQNCMNSVMHH